MQYVFGYGSLVSPESVESTLGHAIDRAAFKYAEITGWKRAWNVGSDRHSHPERTFLRPDGSEFTGVTVVLGLEPGAPTDVCDGSVFAVSERDLTLLDVRERNYDRVDVTSTVTWPEMPSSRVVYTYLPSALARRRLDDARASRRPINVRRAYKELVEAAFARTGRLELYRRTTPPVPYPVEDMTAIVPAQAAADDTAPVAQERRGTRQNG